MKLLMSSLCCFCIWSLVGFGCFCGGQVQAQQELSPPVQGYSSSADVMLVPLPDSVSSDLSGEGEDKLFTQALGDDASSAPGSLFGILTRLGLGLGLVVLLAWGVIWLLRRSGIGRQFGVGGESIRIVDRTFLAPKKAIFLVEIGGRILALGVTDSNISPLSEWQEGELELPQSSAATGSFVGHFRNALGQGGGGQSVVEGPQR